jgi:nucleotide-binding universal stress UspA family protein
MASLLLGSVSVAVSRHGVCPVVVVRPFHPGKVRRGIVVGTDAGEHTQPTLEFAYRQASLRNQPLTVVHCVPFLDDPQIPLGLLAENLAGTDEHQLALAESVAGLAEKFPDVRAQLRLGQGTPEHCLLGLSDTMDLVVVGRHHSGSRGELIGLGSCAPAVIEGASCPVAVVHQSGSEVHHG